MIITSRRLAFGSQRPHDFESCIADSNDLANRIVVANQILDDSLPKHGNAATAGKVQIREIATARQRPTADVEVRRMYAPDTSPSVGVAAHHDITRPKLAGNGFDP